MTASTSRHWKRHESTLQVNVTQELQLPFLGEVQASVWGIGLAGCRFLCAGRYTALLISLLGMSGAALSTRLMTALNLRGTCS